MLSIDSSVLLGYFQAKTGQGVTALNLGSGLPTAAQKTAPTPPWDPSSKVPNASALVKQVLAGHSFINPNAAQLDVAGASGDYSKLFTLYQGLNALEGLAAQAAGKGVSALQLSQYEKTFTTGVSQIASYVDALKLDGLRMTLGATGTKAATTVGVPADNETYATGAIHTGALTTPVAAFQGEVKFDITAKRINDGNTTVSIDLGDMGSTERTLPNVINFINGKLKDAGLRTRFATNQLPTPTNTIQVGSKTVTLPDAPQQWGWKVVGDSAETLSFAAPKTAGAVYLAQTVGKVPSTTTGVTSSTTTPSLPQQQQLLKFQTDISTSAQPAPDAVALPGTANKVDGEAFAKTLGSEVGAVHATAAGPDGSVYVLADVTGTTSGQTIQGAQDVALMKYDSAGKLIYTRTLGAGGSASGLALSVSADGHVAVAGSVTGVLTPGDSGVDADTADSFVTVFNAAGEESWTQRRAASATDQANAVAFGADGSVYVAGQASSGMPGGGSLGGGDGYLQGFDSTGKSLFTRQFGTSSSDKATALTVSGSTVYVGGVDNGHGVVRSYDVSTPAAPVLTATRDLGDLKGGSIAGLAVDSGRLVVAGSSGGTLNAGTATLDYTSGQDAFVAKLQGDLAANASDRIAYYGGAGQDTATGLAVSNGEVWLTGSSTGDLPGQAKVGTKDGYLARIDIDAGTVDFARRFTGQDGQVAPTAIAVDPTGSSVLDRLGLPTGTLQTTDLQLLTAATSVRAGDQFQIRTRVGGPFTTVTIAQDDTLASLSLKIQRASGFQANVSTATLNGHRTLQIKPLNSRVSLEILPGKSGQNALDALGLTPGVVQTAPSAKSPGPPQLKAYGLNLPDTLDLGTPAGVAAAQKALLAALSTVRTAYRDLSKPATTDTKPVITGKAPAYLTAQIANYQAGLDRLNAGGSSYGFG